ncbi:MAG: PKD domain-containing protein, partial [Ferruginibacter sp.]
KVNFIQVKVPIANFSYQRNCNDKLKVIFKDLSIGADIWNWDFGDGQTSTQQDPIHVYANPGLYTVSQYVSNSVTLCVFTKIYQVRVVEEIPNFFASDTLVCLNTPITFTAPGINAANINSFTWNFGSGLTGSGQNPAPVQYATAGIYPVSLILTDANGCIDTLTKQNYISVEGVTADFRSMLQGTCLSNLVSFADLSHVSNPANPIVSWIWDYGDGVVETLSQPPFQHNYPNSGIYTVSLTVIDSKGCSNTIRKVDFLLISHPVAQFTSIDTLVCAGSSVVFTNQSTGTALNYSWEFGDGSISSAQHPSHAYATDGQYPVKLKIQDNFGCVDSITKLSYIRVASPSADFMMSDSVSNCPPLFLNFYNQSQNANTYLWDFGSGVTTTQANPSHAYNLPGHFTVKLTVSRDGRCASSIEKTVTVHGPSGTLAYVPLVGCDSLRVSFVATTQDRQYLIWDFNDGILINTPDSIVQHTYLSPGDYIPKLILIDSNNCRVSISGADTIHLSSLQAQFSNATTVLCDSGNVAFTSQIQTPENTAFYQWDFGDGSFSTQAQPTHQYHSPGNYYPTLNVVTGYGCRDSMRATVPIKIVAAPVAAIQSSASGCMPLNANFLGVLVQPDTAQLFWNWQFSNGNIAAIQQPPVQLFADSGVHQIQLIVKDRFGCADTVQHSITAYPLPNTNAGIDTFICNGGTAHLTATGAVSYVWNNASSLSCFTCETPIAHPVNSTLYIVEGSSAFGCKKSDSVWVNVSQPFHLSVSADVAICKGTSTVLTASGANTYSWAPANGLLSNASASVIAMPDTTTTYQVIGKGTQSCNADTAYILVTIKPLPQVDAGPDQIVMAGQTAQLLPTVSSDVISAQWTPASTVVQTNYPGATVMPQHSTVYQVEVTNGLGCKAVDSVKVGVLCNGSNLFMPNAFSPNGDGLNDVFFPRGTGLFKIASLQIFNRWGETVFSRVSFQPNDAAAGWNGLYKGAPVNSDVFIYIIEVICENSTIMQMKGNVTLIR